MYQHWDTLTDKLEPKGLKSYIKLYIKLWSGRRFTLKSKTDVSQYNLFQSKENLVELIGKRSSKNFTLKCLMKHRICVLLYDLIWIVSFKQNQTSLWLLAKAITELSLSLILAKDTDNPLNRSQFKKRKGSATSGKCRKGCPSPSRHDFFFWLHEKVPRDFYALWE